MSSLNLGECCKCHATEAAVSYRSQALCRSCYEANVPSWDRDQLRDLAQNTSEGHVLFYSNTTRLVGSIGIIFLVAVGAMAVAVGLRQPSNVPQFVICIGLAGVTWMTALAYIADLFFVRISWNDQAITSEAPWQGRRIIHWSDLHHVSYVRTRLTTLLVLHSSGSGKVRVGDLRIGYSDFIHDVRRFAQPDIVASLHPTC